jgi:hypothetical protein
VTTSSDGQITATVDTATASVKISVQLSGASPAQYVAVKRVNPDGSTVNVRGGNLAGAPGGGWYGFDHEAPLGATCSWYVYGATSSATVTAPSTMASATTPTGVWLKHLAFPARSMAVSMTPKWSQEIYAGRVGAAQAVGAQYPAAVGDVRSSLTGIFTVETNTKAEADALRLLLSDGQPLLLQGDAAQGFYDMFLQANDVRPDRSQTALAGWALRLWQVYFTEVARPTTLGSKVAVPGHTYADITPAGRTYAQAVTTDATYAARAT